MDTHYQKRNLARLIKQNRLPDDPDIDWGEVYRFWLKGHNKIKTSYKKPKEPWQIYRHRAYSMNYRAKKKGASGIIIWQDLLEVLRQHNNKCKKCGKTEHLVFDHIKPYYRGGTNTKDNIQVLCRICNMEKGII